MKKYKFLLFVLLLGFVFIPKHVFAAEIDSNKVQIGTQELFWDGTNAQGGYESGRFNSTQNHIYQWGTSTATYKLFRFAPLVKFTSLGVDTSYKARVAFYIYVDQPYSYDDKYCTLFSGNGEKYSCSLYKEMDDQIGSSSSLLTFVYDFEWTSSSGYVEFWLNFDNFHGVPDKTQFMYTILDFQGNVSGNQIILDGLGQTNKKLDEVKDTINKSFNTCYKNELKPFDFSDTSKNGITIKNNGNGTFTLNGTASSYTAFYMQQLSLTPNIYYTLSGGYNDNGILQIIDYKNNPSTKSNGSTTFYNTESSGQLYIVIFEGTSLNNVIFKPMLVKGKNLYEFVSPGKEKCINRIDETNKKLDDLTDSINNDNVSGATNTGNDFFDNFKDSDNGGISGIITAPLNAINAMLNGTCQPLSTTYKGKTISLQCGTDMWNKLSSIRDFINLVLGGLLCYRICLKIFQIVQNLKNPDNDKVEVMNL